MGLKHPKMESEKTPARNRIEAMVDKLGGFCSFSLLFPKFNVVQEPQQTPLF